MQDLLTWPIFPPTGLSLWTVTTSLVLNWFLLVLGLQDFASKAPIPIQRLPPWGPQRLGDPRAHLRASQGQRQNLQVLHPSVLLFAQDLI